jgi:hypothetical protein
MNTTTLDTCIVVAMAVSKSGYDIKPEVRIDAKGITRAGFVGEFNKWEFEMSVFENEIGKGPVFLSAMIAHYLTRNLDSYFKSKPREKSE